MVHIASLLGSQCSAMDLEGLMIPVIPRLLRTAPSGDDGSTVETNLTSWGFVTISGTLT